ncbi:MAG: hypothetical protein P8X90_24815, partial [Desulfobacterales bacterium]
EDQSDNAIGILFPDAPQGPSVFILKIRICFSGADESKITHCVSASASNVAKAMVDRSDFDLRASGSALRATTGQDDGTSWSDILRRQLNGAISRPDNGNDLSCQPLNRLTPLSQQDAPGFAWRSKASKAQRKIFKGI